MVTLLVVRSQVLSAHRGTASDAARALLRRAVAGYSGVPVAAVRIGSLCDRCGSSAHGRPYVRPAPGWVAPHVSLSRCEGLVVVAVTDAGPVGVDVEPADAARFAGFDDVVLHAAERMTAIAGRTRTWVRKESVLKAGGRGLADDPREVRVSAPGDPPELVEWPTSSWPAGAGTTWMYDLTLPADHVGSVAVLAAARPELREVPGDGP